MKGFSIADELDELADDTEDAPAELVKVLVEVELLSDDETDDKIPLLV